MAKRVPKQSTPSHDRPTHELLDPKAKNIRRIFENEFAGMTVDSVSYEDLIAARDTLVKTLRERLTSGEREFLVSLKAGQPRPRTRLFPGHDHGQFAWNGLNDLNESGAFPVISTFREFSKRGSCQRERSTNTSTAELERTRAEG